MQQIFPTYNFQGMRSLRYRFLPNNYQCRMSTDHLQIIPASYSNEIKRIHIPGLPDNLVPGSPEDIRIPVPPSGVVSPMAGLGTPQNGAGTPQNGVRTPQEPVDKERLSIGNIDLNGT